jgi:hypothetical protein
MDASAYPEIIQIMLEIFHSRALQLEENRFGDIPADVSEQKVPFCNAMFPIPQMLEPIEFKFDRPCPCGYEEPGGLYCCACNRLNLFRNIKRVKVKHLSMEYMCDTIAKDSGEIHNIIFRSCDGLPHLFSHTMINHLGQPTGEVEVTTKRYSCTVLATRDGPILTMPPLDDLKSVFEQVTQTGIKACLSMSLGPITKGVHHSAFITIADNGDVKLVDGNGVTKIKYEDKMISRIITAVEIEHILDLYLSQVVNSQGVRLKVFPQEKMLKGFSPCINIDFNFLNNFKRSPEFTKEDEEKVPRGWCAEISPILASLIIEHGFDEYEAIRYLGDMPKCKFAAFVMDCYSNLIHLFQ